MGERSHSHSRDPFVIYLKVSQNSRKYPCCKTHCYCRSSCYELHLRFETQQNALTITVNQRQWEFVLGDMRMRGTEREQEDVARSEAGGAKALLLDVFAHHPIGVDDGLPCMRRVTATSSTQRAASSEQHKVAREQRREEVLHAGKPDKPPSWSACTTRHARRAPSRDRP